MFLVAGNWRFKLEIIYTLVTPTTVELMKSNRSTAAAASMLHNKQNKIYLLNNSLCLIMEAGSDHCIKGKINYMPHTHSRTLSSSDALVTIRTALWIDELDAIYEIERTDDILACGVPLGKKVLVDT